MAEPEVTFERSDEQAKVTVEQQEPQINVQRQGQPQAQQQLSEGGQAPGQMPEGGQPQGQLAGAETGDQQQDQQQAQVQPPPSDEEPTTAGNEQPTPTARERLQESAGAGEQQEQPEQAQAQPEGQAQQEEQAATTQGATTQAATTEEQSEPQDQAAMTEESPLAAMPASDVIGAEVQNRDGDTVAEIVDLVKRQGEEDLFAVLSVGGFLGIGDKRVVVPVNELEVGQEGQIVMAAASEEQLKDMPEYEEEGFESTAQAEQPPAQQQ